MVFLVVRRGTKMAASVVYLWSMSGNESNGLHSIELGFGDVIVFLEASGTNERESMSNRRFVVTMTQLGRSAFFCAELYDIDGQETLASSGTAIARGVQKTGELAWSLGRAAAALRNSILAPGEDDVSLEENAAIHRDASERPPVIYTW